MTRVVVDDAGVIDPLGVLNTRRIGGHGPDRDVPDRAGKMARFDLPLPSPDGFDRVTRSCHLQAANCQPS